MGSRARQGSTADLEGSALPLGPSDLAGIMRMEKSIMKKECRGAFTTSPSGRRAVQTPGFLSPSAVGKYAHLLKNAPKSVTEPRQRAGRVEHGTPKS